MSPAQLKEWVKEKILAHPGIAIEIRDIYVLCLDEIEEGGSEQHEIELCVNDIEQLIREESK